MTAELKDIEVFERDKKKYPIEDYGVYVNMTLSIGPADEEGEHLFYLIVMDIKCLYDSISDPEMGKGTMIVRDYDLEAVTKKIKECIAKCETGDFWTTAINLSRYFDWEFENYKPYVPETDA